MARRTKEGYVWFPKWQWKVANFLNINPEEIFQLQGWNDWRGKLWCALHFGKRHEFGPNLWYYPGPPCCFNCGKVDPKHG